MDNLKSPAHPIINDEGSHEDREVHYGFTKLEKAALMIAQGMMAHSKYTTDFVAPKAVEIAKAILQEANK